MDESKLKDQNILLVKEKDSYKLKAVSSIDKNGKLEMVEAKGENASRFLKFDRNNKAELETVMTDFNRQASNLKDFRLFQVRYGKFAKLKEGLEEVLFDPHHPEAKDLLKPYEVNPKDYVAKQRAEDPKVLLVRGEDGKLKAFSEGKDGKLKTVEPGKGNADSFLNIDTHGNALENFFKKFSAQFNNPSHIGVFAVSAKAVDIMAAFLDKVIKTNPEDKVLDPYRITPEGRMQEQAQGKFQPLDLNRLDWKEVDKLGLSGQSLQDSLKAMAYGHKSPGLLEIRMEINGRVYEDKARLSLEQQPDGSIRLITHPRQEQPDFDKPFMGVMLTEADKEQLMKTGHGGRVFELEMTPGGEKVPSLVSLDKLTNRLEAVPLSEINISSTLKNAPLSPEQQQGLREGRAVWVEGMDKRVKPGEEPKKIDRFVQFNAVSRNFDFRFNSEQKQQYKEERQAKREQQPGQEQKEKKGQFAGKIWVPKVLLGVKLTDEQFNSILAGKPTWIEGMTQPQSRQAQGETQVEATDAKGQKFNAWVRPEQEAGKLKYYKWNPEKSQKQGQEAKPAEGYKTQVAVNNEGKTSEATKHSQQPLKTGQVRPDEKQHEQQQRQVIIPQPKRNARHKV